MGSDRTCGRCWKCGQRLRADFDAHSFDCVPWFSRASEYLGLTPGDVINVAVTEAGSWFRATVRTTHPAGALVDVAGDVITHGDPGLVVESWTQYVTQKDRKGKDVWYR